MTEVFGSYPESISFFSLSAFILHHPRDRLRLSPVLSAFLHLSDNFECGQKNPKRATITVLGVICSLQLAVVLCCRLAGFLEKLSKHCRKFVNFNSYCQSDRPNWPSYPLAAFKVAGVGGFQLHFPIVGLSKLWQSSQWVLTVPFRPWPCQFWDCCKFVTQFAAGLMVVKVDLLWSY